MKYLRITLITSLLAAASVIPASAAQIVDFTSTFRVTNSGVAENQDSNDIGNNGGTTTADQHVALISFLLPDLGGKALASADLQIGISGTTDVFNGDLYAIRVDPDNDATTADHQTGSDSLSWGAETLKLQDNFLNELTSTGVLSLSATGQSNLLSYLNTNYAAGEYFFIAMAADNSGVGKNFSRFSASGPTADQHNLMLTPVPEPGALQLLILGAVTLSGFIRRRP